MKKNNLINKKFGRLTVLEFAENYKWLCKCECGKEKIVYGCSLRSGNTKSCGCLNKEVHTKHGHSIKGKRSKTYMSWASMLKRCNNPNHKDYKNYGGRGVKVCDRWLNKENGFENFLEDMGEMPGKHQIDRTDNDGNYEPTNCRWVTPKENCRNRRNNHLITYKNQTKCLAEWAEELNINYNTLHVRINRDKWPIEKSFETLV